jgi:diguanylate cyclase
MDLSAGAAAAAAAESPVQLAKAALRRLALERVEPTPENFARAYAAESGLPPAPLPEAAQPALQRLGAHFGEIGAPGDELVRALVQGRWVEAQALAERCTLAAAAQANDWAGLTQRLAQGLGEGSRAWPAGRKNDSLQRVFDGSRGDPRRLRLRLDHLLSAWRDGSPDPDAGDDPSAAAPGGGDWLALVQELEATVQTALAGGEPAAAAVAQALRALAERVAGEGASAARVREADELCGRARRNLVQRQRLLDELGRLCVEMTDGLVELAEDDSWARGQCEAMRRQLSAGLDVRSVRAAAELLADARRQQAALRGERSQARGALDQVIDDTLGEMGQFVEETGRFQQTVGRHAQAIEQAQSLDGLAGAVREMLHDSREVQDRVGRTQERLRAEQARAGAMRRRVRELEDELRRLSDEVCTDALTQVANRRGLAQAFDAERARLHGSLALGLIDIDNFKRLNDTLGHAAGDVALQRLAAEVRDKLRPGDTVARFGGEEFVVLLPGADAAGAQQMLTRLQRQLSARLFMHDSREVFVTFSAGVTAVRDGETLEAAVERADEALYEAKRTGKNRTCVA